MADNEEAGGETLTDQEIIDLWKSPSFYGSSTGIKTFQRALEHEKNVHVPEARLKSILNSIDSYQMHVISDRHGLRAPRRQYDVRHSFASWQMDLAEQPQSENGFKYFIVTIDLYSRFISCEPLRDKKSETVRTALQHIFDSFPSLPSLIACDQGNEFVSQRKWLKSLGIVLTLKRGQLKASFAEAAIKIIKRRLYVFMRSNLVSQWDLHIGGVVRRINETPLEARQQEIRQGH